MASEHAPRTRFEALVHEVCVERGWCGGALEGRPCHVTDFIPENGPVAADQFVDWLFMADGMDPTAEPEKWQQHKEDLRHAFVRHMENVVVDARRLRWVGC